ncbi:MAG: biotin/lipoyl-containing protein [Asgard group archaeon]|nr:biotin/lipoyl-containing protein [Asgard group archaeon]
MHNKKYTIRLNGFEFTLTQSPDGLTIKEQLFKPELFFNGESYHVFVNGMDYKIQFKNNNIFVNGKEVDFSFNPTPYLISKKGAKSKKSHLIKAAIPGKIVEIKVEKGDTVEDQQCLLILESMKMRNEILSPLKGEIRKIYVSNNAQVSTNQKLMEIKPRAE